MTFEDVFAGRYGYNKPYKHMTADLKDRVAVVTGSGGMIGGVCADLLAASGAKIAVVDIREEYGEKQVQKIKDAGGDAKFFAVDLGNRKSIDALVENVIAYYGRIDILINNAGINQSNRVPFTQFDDKMFWPNIDINLNSLVYLSGKVVPYMIKQGGGSIVNTTSVCGVTGLRNQCPFVASKFAVSAVTRSMALEYGKYNIRVNALAPGSLPLPSAEFMGKEWSAANNWSKVTIGDDYDKNFENPGSMIFDMPQRRVAYPTDMAGIFLYLCSDDACYTTGQVIAVDGGWTCGYSADY